MAFYYLCPLSEIKKLFFIFWIMRVLYERKCPREEKIKRRRRRRKSNTQLFFIIFLAYY